MRILIISLCSLLITGICYAQPKALLLEDFEGAVCLGQEGTVDLGAGNGSSMQVRAATDVKNTGSQSLKIEYDAVAGGYMWVAKGSGLDARNAQWQAQGEHINWQKYTAISFYAYGSASGADIAFDLKDRGNELWRYIWKDDFKGWKKIVVAFSELRVHAGWQPESADKNQQLDFPIKSFQFEPISIGKGVLYIDTVELE